MRGRPYRTSPDGGARSGASPTMAISHSRVNTPSPVVVSATSPSLAVIHSLSLAGSSIHCASVVPALQLAAEGNAWMVPAPAPPSAEVSASTVSLRGWQYVLFVPSPAIPAEMTAYFGLARSRNAADDEVLLP